LEFVFCSVGSLIQGDSGIKDNIWGGDSVGHCEKKVHFNLCLILNVYRDKTISISRTNFVRFFCVCVWMKSEVYQTKVDTPDEFLTCIVDAAACLEKREDQLRRTTRDLRTRVAKCTEVDGGIFEHLS
jgi:hypothetical protein